MTNLKLYERQQNCSNGGDDSFSSIESEERGDNTERPPLPPANRRLCQVLRTLSTRSLNMGFAGHAIKASNEPLSPKTEVTASDSSSDISEDDEASQDSKQTPSVTSDLKLSGTKWKHTEDNQKYAQLCFVPQETIILVRRAPPRQRSVRKVVRAHVNDSMPSALGNDKQNDDDDIPSHSMRTGRRRAGSTDLSDTSLHKSGAVIRRTRRQKSCNL
jgi:hypothetical protein